MSSLIVAKAQEIALFLSRFLRKPNQIGSVLPSSKFLAQKMIASVSWHQVDSMAELGAGTGAITQYIPKAVKKNTKVLLFEKDPYLRSLLEKRYSNFYCYEDCCELQLGMQNEKIEQLDCILCGLPFFNFSQPIRDQLMAQIYKSLKPDGLFIAFQYSQQMKKQLSQHFDIEEILFVPMNVPPAFVYICRKKERC
ncbi:class I SAM-dependent methyltransferase [Paenibacillus sp. N3.4]|uniref:class I SAM-dependent methyltransferase n=1 Tax=Paenibacillus sp. N3.4 TaxID=2603222 RepID=UPI0011C78434|nr:methyltransferase domain-containing protein [Paenibacillus sp. N3.4]TXK86128.1 methyltransferase domain-containing protein [Paenibacillus sp. N3.4]